MTWGFSLMVYVSTSTVVQFRHNQVILLAPAIIGRTASRCHRHRLVWNRYVCKVEHWMCFVF